jgi:hypothetical protein
LDWDFLTIARKIGLDEAATNNQSTGMIGDIIPCSNWFHGDDCQNEDCKRQWKERGEDRHAGCWMCKGSMRLRVIEESVTPYGTKVTTVEPSKETETT